MLPYFQKIPAPIFNIILCENEINFNFLEQITSSSYTIPIYIFHYELPLLNFDFS